jgi:oligopeptide/dipeptide ABC transporter ATP-binding protein
MSNLLDVKDLWVRFDTPQGAVDANRAVTLSVNYGETLGLMGESGCGKSVLALSLLRLQNPARIIRGSISLEGRDLLLLSEREMRAARGRLVALMPQDHGTSLNPLQTIGTHLFEAIAVRDGVRGLWRNLFPSRNGKGNSVERAVAALRSVGFHSPERIIGMYPHQLSGGMRQRVLIALIGLLEPKLAVCDEPTTALDTRTKKEVMYQLSRLKEHTSLLLISHDIMALRALSDRIAVMYAGAIVEEGSRDEVLLDPLHPYTRGLLSAQRCDRGSPLTPIPGDSPDLLRVPEGCAFHPRCPISVEVCRLRKPTERAIGKRRVACYLYD